MNKIFAKKSLGQNFLKSKQALRDIRDAGDITGEDIILEVGPGKGALTETLLFFAAKVIAIEKDHRLIPVLQEKFDEEIKNGKLEILEKDILEFDPSILKFYDLPYKVIANIPYYITGQFLRKFLETNHKPKLMVLLLQKEVAERIAARDGKESILSLSVKAYGKPKYIKKVQAKYFSPEPKVDSAILLIDDISNDFFIQNGIKEERFFEIVKAGFAHKRKMLLGNLKTHNKESGEETNWERIFDEIKIPPKVRAEDLSLADWKKILEKI